MAKTNFKFDGSISATIRDSSYAKFFVALADGDFLINIVKSFITVGLSPVYSIGRFQRYSESYKMFLKGQIRFVTMNGAVRAIFPFKTKIDKKTGGEFSPLSFSKISGGRKQGEGETFKIQKIGGGVKGKFPLPFPNKKTSPVSMSATGQMLNSMYLEKKGSKIILGISDYKAQYHNDLGAGKSKVIRRLLPTKSGEKFITNIDSRLKRLGKLAVQNALNEKKSLLIVNYVFKGKK